MILGARAAGHGTSDPAQFDGWAPQGSLAVAEALRVVLAHHRAGGPGPVWSARLTRAIGEVIKAQDRLVCVPHPDDPFEVPIYEGRGSLAWRRLAVGVYDATGFEGRGEYKLVIAPPLQHTGAPISAVFPAWAAHAAVLQQISAVVTSPVLDEEHKVTAIAQVLHEAGWLDTDEYGRPATMGKRHDLLAERAAMIRQAQLDDTPIAGDSPGFGPTAGLP